MDQKTSAYDQLRNLGIKIQLIVDKFGERKPIRIGDILNEDERVYVCARVPSHIKVYGREDKKQPLELLKADEWIGYTPVYRARVLVFRLEQEALILVVGKNKETCEVWRSLKMYDYGQEECRNRSDLPLSSKDGGASQLKAIISDTSNDSSGTPEEVKSRPMSDIKSKIETARMYRAELEDTYSGVLFCRKEELRQRFGGEYMKVHVSRENESVLDIESIAVYPPLHQAKDLVLLVHKESDCFKKNPELFENNDPYTIAQSLVDQICKEARA